MVALTYTVEIQLNPASCGVFSVAAQTALLLFSMVNARRSKPLEQHSAARGIMS